MGRNEWEDWTVVTYEGPHLEALLAAGAPTLAAIQSGMAKLPHRPARPGPGGDPYALTERWAGVVLRASALVLPLVVSDPELRAAVLSTLQLGGAERAGDLVQSQLPRVATKVGEAMAKACGVAALPVERVRLPPGGAWVPTWASRFLGNVPAEAMHEALVLCRDDLDAREVLLAAVDALQPVPWERRLVVVAAVVRAPADLRRAMLAALQLSGQRAALDLVRA